MEDYIVISKNWLEEQKRSLGTDEEILKDIYALTSLSVYLNIQIHSKPLRPIIENTYEAGKLDAKLSLSFDNPKSRYISQFKLDI